MSAIGFDKHDDRYVYLNNLKVKDIPLDNIASLRNAETLSAVLELAEYGLDGPPTLLVDPRSRAGPQFAFHVYCYKNVLSTNHHQYKLHNLVFLTFNPFLLTQVKTKSKLESKN